jgi:hypothetical protein
MEREEVSFFISWARSSPARQREREQDARLQIEVRLSFKVGEYIYMQQAHQQYYYYCTYIEKAWGLRRSLLCWMDNIPKGLARLLRLKPPSVSGALHLFIFIFLYFYIPTPPYTISMRLDSLPISQVASIFTLG